MVWLPLALVIWKIINSITGGYFTLKLNVDENLHNYFEALDSDDKRFSVLEEENMRKNYVIFML